MTTPVVPSDLVRAITALRDELRQKRDRDAQRGREAPERSVIRESFNCYAAAWAECANRLGTLLAAVPQETAPPPQVEAELVKHGATVRDAVMAQQIAVVANRYGWNGVTNSKILSTFIEDELAELGQLRARAASPTPWQPEKEEPSRQVRKKMDAADTERLAAIRESVATETSRAPKPTTVERDRAWLLALVDRLQQESAEERRQKLLERDCVMLQRDRAEQAEGALARAQETIQRCTASLKGKSPVDFGNLVSCENCGASHGFYEPHECDAASPSPVAGPIPQE